MANGTKITSVLSPAKRELLSRLRSKQGWQAEPSINIPRRADNGPCPLSFAQQRLWFLDQLEPGGSAYNVPVEVEITGRLNLMVIERVVNEIVRRHEVLRTSFTVEQGVPKQIIAPMLRLTVKWIDLEHLDETERHTEARRLAAAEAEQPFVLERAPLMRVKVLRFDSEKFIMLLTTHHIISDAWSMGVLIQEMTALYRAFNEGQPPPLPELPVQYADFALWQREQLQGEVLQEALAYWKKQLGDRPETFELPTDFPRPPVQTFRGAQLSFELSPTLTAALKDLSRRENVTLFMTLMAGWQILLARYSGAEESIVGTPIANRRRVVTEGLIGFFVNTLVMRTSLPPEITFKALLKHVQEVALGAYAHQDLPFEKLVEELQPERESSHNPFFQVVFGLQNAPAPELRIEGLTFRIVAVDHQNAKFDLTLNMVDTADGLQGTLQYNTDLFEAATISRLITHFKTLLQGIVNAPESRISSLPLLPAEEREQLLYQWNQKQREYHGDSCLHQWFERQVERTPAAVALVFDQVRLSYRELNERANQLAHYLRRLGIGPEVMVGLYVERSPEMVVAILGILKAGGAYVPLDTMYPKDRLAFMLEDASIRLVLSQSELTAALPDREMTVVTLDTEWETLASQNTENPPNLTTSENLAYVIFTSGSTGRPKGTLVSHGNVARLFEATEDWYHFDERDVWTLFHSSAFDFSVWELWGALLYGGSLVIVPFILSRSPEAFYELLLTEHVTVLNQTPSAFRQLMQVDREAWSRSNDLDLRLVIFGGEALEVRSLSEWYERHAEERPRLVNMYGITETTVHVTYRPLSRIDAETRYASPIGCAIPDLELYILDAQLGPVPIGVPGALYVGGSGLARGYLNRPELTAERFIPHPYSTNPGARLYQTGDLARYGSDGDIEYLGRIDQQVKIRGFRIELGEIEAVMRSHPAIRDVVVVAREDEPGEKRLVGYFVAAMEMSLTIDDLRSYLKETLAEYMIPTSFVILDHMPLTAQGKVDRKALPAPDSARPYLQEEFVAPRTWQEQKLAEIWSQYLGVDPIGIHDNFFVLGGHSLLATQLISQIREVFKVELPLRALFEAPTIAALGERVEVAIEAGRGLLLPDIERVARTGPLPLSFAQQRLWFIDQLEPNSAAYNLPLAMRLSGPLNLAALERSLSEIIRRHESLRTSFPVRDGRPVQLINDAQLLSIPITDLSELSAAEREAAAVELAHAEARRTFELASGPLLRVSLLRLDEEQHVALMTMHHIVADGWSLSVLVKEMTVLYEAYSRGLESPLEELSVQYADFAVWQRGWLKGDLLETQLEYWRKQLSGAAVLALPTDRVRPAAPTFRGATHNMQVGKEVTEGLKDQSRRAGVTLFMTLLAAFKTLLYRLNGQEDVVVGTGIANRTRGEVEGLIGFFTNTLVLRTDLSGDPSFSELLGRVRDVTLGAYSHQDVPFEKLVEELEPERYLGHAPLFQVMFSFHNSPIEPLTLSGLTLQPFNTTAGTAHFELLLAMQEVQEEIQGTFEYNTDLFDEATITRISNHFRVLLEGIVAHPEWSLIDLPLFPVDEASGRPDRPFLESEDNEEEFSFQR